MSKEKEKEVVTTEEQAPDTPAPEVVTAPKTKVVKAEVPVKVKTPAPQIPRTGNKIYLGPTLEGVAKNGEVYKDGILPEKAKAYIFECPAFDKLFVDLADSSEAMKELRTPNSALCEVYKLATTKFKGR